MKCFWDYRDCYMKPLYILYLISANIWHIPIWNMCYGTLFMCGGWMSQNLDLWLSVLKRLQLNGYCLNYYTFQLDRSPYYHSIWITRMYSSIECVYDNLMMIYVHQCQCWALITVFYIVHGGTTLYMALEDLQLIIYHIVIMLM